MIVLRLLRNRFCIERQIVKSRSMSLFNSRGLTHLSSVSASRVWGGATLLVAVLTLSFRPWLAASNTPTGPALVVEKIEKVYLYADSPGWIQARKVILAGENENSNYAYGKIADALATVRDSELHLVSPSDLTSINAEISGTIVGTGLIDFAIDLDRETGEARVVTPLIGSPAANAGIRPRDVLVSVNGQPTVQMNHEQVMNAFRNSLESIAFRIRRAGRVHEIRLRSSVSPLVPVVSDLKHAGQQAIGYIRIVQFTPNSGDLARNAVLELEKRGASGYILDLRNNPGGSLPAAVTVTSMFVQGTLGIKIRRNGQAEPITSEGQVITTKPVVVLVNDGTASAAEFVAAALQDRHRAELLGSPTYGRGQTQILASLTDGFGVIIPSALLETTAGRKYKDKGLDPDIQITQPALRASLLTTERDRQFQAALCRLAPRNRPKPCVQ